MAPQCQSNYNSQYDKSSLHLLYGGLRKTLFGEPHPIGGIAITKVGIKTANAFFDLKKQELEYKDKTWRVKANVGGSQLFNLKMKVGEKVKGAGRNNIQFGRDKQHFGGDPNVTKLAIGGMVCQNIAGLIFNMRMKVFTDQVVETFIDTSVAGATVAGDLQFSPSGGPVPKGFLGVSYGLPMSLPMLSNLHVGSIFSLQKGIAKASLGVFGEATLPNVQKAIVGGEVCNQHGSQPVILVGTELKFDEDHSLAVKASFNGIAHVSCVKKFQGIHLRMGTELNMKDMSCGSFGASVKLLH